jgi:hypothetical protein
MNKILQNLDFGVRNFRYLFAFTVFLTVSSVVFSPFTISVDGFSYLKSSEVLFSEDFATFYTWVREPGYPLFLRFFEDLGGLFLVFLIQALFISFGILATILASYRILNISSTSWRTYFSAGAAIVLISGYASTILQQASLVGLFGLLMIVISRIVTKRAFDWFTAGLTFTLILLSTLVAVFLGLAFGLALFATLVFTGVLNLRLLLSYSTLSILAFIMVMIPWSQIKSTEAPSDALDALEMGAFNTSSTLANFNPEKEFYEALLTQAALINLGGEFPPISGLGVANENRIFGAPVYSTDHACGRFLTGQDPDSLWGKIDTSYRDRCVPLQTLNVISNVNRVSQFLYPLTGLALLVTLGLSIGVAPRLRPLIFPAFLITLPYIVMDASISRYGALIIPLGAVFLFELGSQRLIKPPSPIRVEYPSAADQHPTETDKPISA